MPGPLAVQAQNPQSRNSSPGLFSVHTEFMAENVGCRDAAGAQSITFHSQRRLSTSQVCHCHTDKRISHFKTSFHLYDHTVLKVCIKSPFGLLVVLVCENLWFHRESIPGLTQAGHGSCSELSVASPGEASLRPRRFTQRPCVLDSCSGGLAGSRGR